MQLIISERLCCEWKRNGGFHNHVGFFMLVVAHYVILIFVRMRNYLSLVLGKRNSTLANRLPVSSVIGSGSNIYGPSSRM